MATIPIYHATIVPPVTGAMSTEYFQTFLDTTMNSTSGELVSILHHGKMVLVWREGIHPLSPVLSWVQIGQLIDNGFICDIDASGNRIVIGSLQLGGSSTQVYDWDGTNWVQLGNTITGTYTLFGNDYNVGAGGAISGDGTWLAIRSGYTNDPGDAASVVLMFNWDGINWVLKSVLEGTGGSFDNFGYTITFNSLDGLDSRLVIGGVGGDANNYGKVYGYKLEDQSGTLRWIQRDTVIGQEPGEIGRSLSVGSDRTIIGNPTYTDINDNVVGSVQFSTFTGGYTAPLYGENDGDRFGDSVSINEAGTRCAIMAKLAIVSEVKVYDLDGTNWIQTGNTIEVPIQSVTNLTDVIVELNAAGDRLAIAANTNWEPNNPSGAQVVIKTFKLVDNNWEQFGSDILGADNVDWNTTDIGVNAAGDRIVFRSFGNNLTPEPGSDVRVYSLESQ